MATPQDGGDSVSDEKPARIDGTAGVNPAPTETVPQGAPESPRVPGQGPGSGDAGAAQRPDATGAQQRNPGPAQPGPGLAYDIGASGPAAAPQPGPAELKDGQVRLATVLPVGSFDAGDGLVIDQYGTVCTPEQAAAARTKALLAGVRLQEV